MSSTNADEVTDPFHHLSFLPREWENPQLRLHGLKFLGELLSNCTKQGDGSEVLLSCKFLMNARINSGLPEGFVLKMSSKTKPIDSWLNASLASGVSRYPINLDTAELNERLKSYRTATNDNAKKRETLCQALAQVKPIENVKVGKAIPNDWRPTLDGSNGNASWDITSDNKLGFKDSQHWLVINSGLPRAATKVSKRLIKKGLSVEEIWNNDDYNSLRQLSAINRHRLALVISKALNLNMKEMTYYLGEERYTGAEATIEDCPYNVLCPLERNYLTKTEQGFNDKIFAFYSRAYPNALCKKGVIVQKVPLKSSVFWSPVNDEVWLRKLNDYWGAIPIDTGICEHHVAESNEKSIQKSKHLLSKLIVPSPIVYHINHIVDFCQMDNKEYNRAASALGLNADNFEEHPLEIELVYTNPMNEECVPLIFLEASVSKDGIPIPTDHVFWTFLAKSVKARSRRNANNFDPDSLRENPAYNYGYYMVNPDLYKKAKGILDPKHVKDCQI